MKKIFLSILCVVLSVLCVACNTAPPQEGSTDAGVTDAPVEETTVYEELPDAPADGTLVYFEDFEGKRAVENAALAGSLKWKLLEKSNFGKTDFSATISLKKHTDGKALCFINCPPDVKSPSEGYVEILSGDKFGYVQDRDYTLQFDMQLSNAEENGYFSLLTDFNGSYYRAFDLYNSGTGKHRIYLGARWYDLEHSSYSEAYAADTGSKSEKTIAYRLLGKYYSGEDVLCDVPLSLRYVNEHGKGVSVYLRVNDPQLSPNAGEWILVSQTAKEAAGFKHLDHVMGDGSIVLKIGGAQNGYIDNIAIWLGTGEEPEDTSTWLLKGAKCHEYVYNDAEEKVCIYCGNVKNNQWLLKVAPEYKGGVLSDRFEYGGIVRVNSSMPENEQSKMQLVSNTTKGEFEAYVKMLDNDSDFTKDYYRESGQNIYASFRNSAGKRVYAYYFGAVSEARITENPLSTPSAEEFGYKYEKKPGDTTVLYQYGLNMARSPQYPDETYGGMLYLIKTADNAIIVIDGGNFLHFDDAESNHLMSFMRDITGTPAGEKVRIAAWLVTHAHQDHMAGFTLFLTRHSKNVEIERIMFNVSSCFSSHGLYSAMYSEAGTLCKYIEKYAGKKYDFYKPQTGELFDIADIQIEVLYSHEDAFDVANAKPTSGEYNNACSVFRIVMDGKVFLVTGDINKPAMSLLMQNQPKELLQADILQPAHHLLNVLTPLYEIMTPSVVLIPGNPDHYKSNTNCRLMQKNFEETADMVLFCYKGTYGVAVENGKLKRVYTDENVYSKGYTGWTWYIK